MQKTTCWKAEQSKYFPFLAEYHVEFEKKKKKNNKRKSEF